MTHKQTLELAAEAVRRPLADRIGERAALAWIHVPSLARHAQQAGLVPDLLAGGGGDATSVIRTAVAALSAAHPALSALADPAVTPIWDGPGLTREEGEALLALWRTADVFPAGEAGDGLVIGELYQALSAEARKGRALVQTPPFIGELLVELSYGRAMWEWGADTRVIDPACGTGHLLMEAYHQVAARMRRGRPRPSPVAVAEATLAALHGVDIDPYAALLTGYRLLALACRASRVALREAPAAFQVKVACADSLLSDTEPLLARGTYHVVAANPPYIACADPVAREAIRRRYRQVCHGKYSLAVAFEPLMHELCVPGGWVARLTSNAFMKREHGRPLIEDYFTQVDLRWIIDSSGVYIPGHGTPTVILVSRSRPQADETVRVVHCERREPARPEDPARAQAWLALSNAVRSREADDTLALRVAEINW
jgi:hypothetical protein